MIRLTKDNKGITLMTLIITVILMLILASVGTYSGINTYKNAQITKFLVQMQLVQSKVDELKQNKPIEELLQMGEEVPNDKEIIITTSYNNGEISNNKIDSYRYFSTENLKNELNLEEGIDGEILINFTTREVISTMGTTYNKITYYTQYLLPGGQKLINDLTQTNRNLSFDSTIVIDGLSAKVNFSNIKITNGTLSYREQGKDYWENITNYTEKDKEESLIISKSGTYQFRLTDNTTGREGMIQKEKLVLTNKPMTNYGINSYNYGLGSDKWAYITDSNGNNYVWIPRFAYKTDNNGQKVIKFLKGTSNISTDNTYIDNTWAVHPKFTSENGEELTGIWTQVMSKNQSGYDIMNLIDSTLNLPSGLQEGDEILLDSDGNGALETWIVLHKNTDNIEVISKNVMGNLTLGSEDSFINWNDISIISNADIDNNSQVSDLEKTIYSYNNVISTLNQYCSNLIKIDNLGVRCVGTNPANPSYEISDKPFSIVNLDKWTNKTGWETYGVLGEIGEQGYSEFNVDYLKMQDLGIGSATNESGEAVSYWFAARYVYEVYNQEKGVGMVEFSMRFIKPEGTKSNKYLWYVWYHGGVENGTYSNPVRPIIKLQYQ